ncbi:MAG: hypothetical protein MJA84_12525, partial [Firmicutes bacterium]|nr:hypothetical protein [Bacillota bacterium]
YDKPYGVERYFEAPGDNNSQDPNADGDQDLKFNKLANFAHNTRSLRGDRKGREELATQDEVYQYNRYHSAMNRIRGFDEKFRAKRQIDPRSTLHKLNERVHLDLYMARRFFRKKMRDNGYISPAFTYPKKRGRHWVGPNPYDNLTVNERLELWKEYFVGLVGNTAQNARKSFILDSAFSAASNTSIKQHEATHELAGPQRGRRDRNESTRAMIAKAVDQSERNREQLKLLTDQGIAKGLDEITRWCKQDGIDSEPLKSQFQEWCNEYNGAVREKIDLRESRRTAMSQSVLQELGSPVLMPSEKEVTHAAGAMQEDVIKERNFSFFKSLFALVSNVLTLSIAGRASSWIRKHYDNIGISLSSTRLAVLFEEKYVNRLSEPLIAKNRQATKEWVAA